MAEFTEQDAGIRSFVNSDLPGFTAILKHRYADFKVNEVDLDGNVVRLTSLEAPKAAGPSAEEEAAAATAATNPGEAVEAAVQRYAELAGEGAAAAQLEALRAFLTQALAWQAAQQQRQQARRAGGAGAEAGDGAAAPQADAPAEPAGPPAPLVLAPMADKERRTGVHRLFKGLPGFPRLETNTVDAPVAGAGGDPQPADQQQQHCIQVAVAAGGSGGGSGGGGRGGGRDGGRGQKRKRRDDGGWAGGALRYTRFVLFKENMDSQQALSSLARMLRVSHKLFAVAGTKDKRGVTVQQVTAFKLDPARLAGLNPRLRGMRLGNFAFAADQLRLGDLHGNRFELVLRGIEAGSAEAVAAAAEGLRSRGFINYYGLQRFGTGAVPTHRIGQALLRGQWRDAVRLLLTPRADCSRPEQAEACRLYLEEGDVEGALALMPRFLVAEPTLLQGLRQHGPAAYLNALMCLPRNLRSMYVHAYQSYLWNAAASHRIDTYGAERAVEDDLVLPRAQAEAARAANRNRGAQQQQQQQQQQGGDDDGSAAAGGGDDDEAVEEAAVGVPHLVTAEEAAAGAYSIEDVVLPMPGLESLYPGHDTAEVYRRLAAADGVSLDAPAHGCTDFSLAGLPGAYRHVLHRPADLEYELLRYAHPDADLASTDLQALQGGAPPPPDGQGPLLGLRLAFTLPASCYATMLIRELTKQPTSVAHHKGMSAAAGAAVTEAGATEAGAAAAGAVGKAEEQG